ncbi:MAG TPA: hypothetical protein VFA71_00435 [Terriglobales bacterium]|nr:hypothetical protein [Terriglobales bacterium]
MQKDKIKKALRENVTFAAGSSVLVARKRTTLGAREKIINLGAEIYDRGSRLGLGR